ncbi:MAG TPA: AsmA family protein [Geminicoccaceae bacterium]|nr:AsmA family protein [Geminicoccaceae bacterium]
MRWILYALLLIVGLPTVLLAGAWLALRQGWLNGVIEARASAATGYDIELGDAPDLAWKDGALRLTLGPLAIANSEDEELATVDRAAAELALGPLLHGDIVLPNVEVEGVDAEVVRGEDGTLNWQPAERPTPSTDGPPIPPLIRHLVVEDAQIDYRDGERDVTLVLDELEGNWGATEPLTLTGAGRLGDAPLSIEGSGPSRQALVDGADEPLQATLDAASTSITAAMQPAAGTFSLDLEAGDAFADFLATLGLAVPTLPAFELDLEGELQGEGAVVDARLTIDRTTLQFDGSVDHFGAATALHGTFRAAGPNPGPILASLGLAQIDTPPYDLEGELTREGSVLTLDGISGTIGDSDIAGSLRIDRAAQPLAVEADLRSRSLDFDDLFPIVGLPPQTGAGETASPEQRQEAQTLDQRPRLIPDFRIDPAIWRGIDLDIELDAAEVRSELFPIDRLAIHLVTREGWITIDPFTTGLADGRLVLFFSFDTTQRPPVGRVDLRLTNLSLHDMLARIGEANEAAGRVDGRVRLEGRGYSLADLLGSSDGQVGLVMSDGSLDAFLVEAVGLDLMEGLITLITPDDAANRVPIRCGVANLQVARGIATARPLLLDTADTKLTAAGTIDLEAETMDLLIEAHPKDPSLLSGNQPLQVEGDWRSPTIAPAPGEVESNTLGWLLAPIAALVPFFDLGLAEDAPCGQLLDEARKAAAEAPDE